MSFAIFRESLPRHPSVSRRSGCETGHPSRRFALACHDSLLCPGRPASVPLRHTVARSALATQHSRKWLDGVSDALAYALRRLGTSRPRATTAIRPRLRLPRTTRLRFALHGAQRMSWPAPLPHADCARNCLRSFFSLMTYSFQTLYSRSLNVYFPASWVSLHRSRKSLQPYSVPRQRLWKVSLPFLPCLILTMKRSLLPHWQDRLRFSLQATKRCRN